MLRLKLLWLFCTLLEIVASTKEVSAGRFSALFDALIVLLKSLSQTIYNDSKIMRGQTETMAEYYDLHLGPCI